MNTLDRFYRKIIVDANGCWIWQCGLDKDGYAKFWWNGQTGRGHRFAYIHFIGPLADGLVTDHTCRTPACVNPFHLEPVTNWENSLRGIPSPPVANAAKTKCLRGHPYDGRKTVKGKTHRICKTCHRRQDRADKKRAYWKNPVAFRLESKERVKNAMHPCADCQRLVYPESSRCRYHAALLRNAIIRGGLPD